MKMLSGNLTLLLTAILVSAEEPALITLENVPQAKRIRANEPFRAEFSAEQAARYLDNASLAWQKRRNCVACHTNMSYMMARPAPVVSEEWTVTFDLGDIADVKRFVEEQK